MCLSDEEKRARLRDAVVESQAAAKALVKDAAALTRQAAVLQELAARTRAETREAREQSLRTGPPPAEGLRTIPEAARHLHVGERTLRHALDEPDLRTRLVERTRKVGIFYKFVALLPPDLVSDLAVRFAARRPSAAPHPPPAAGEEIEPPTDN